MNLVLLKGSLLLTCLATLDKDVPLPKHPIQQIEKTHHLQLRSPNLERILVQIDLQEVVGKIYESSNFNIEAYLGAPRNVAELRRQVKDGKVAKDLLTPRLLRAINANDEERK
jgi:hypothetical protein